MTTTATPVHGPADGRAAPDAILGFIHRIDGHAAVLDRALTRWAGRAGGPDATARRAASEAEDAIDAMTRELYQLRNALGVEMRASDDAAARRVDDLLARRPARQAPAAAALADPEAWAYE